jgi:hypothetical protein
MTAALKALKARSLSLQGKPRQQRECACAQTGDSCSRCANGNKEPAPAVPNHVVEPGEALDAKTRRFMEQRFAHDFSHVRIHHDSHATEAAAGIDALAYTTGNHIVFGAGQYRPDTVQGRYLVAHELAHTIQQRGVQGGLQVADDRRGEDAANRAAANVVLGRIAASPQPNCTGIQRFEKSERNKIAKIDDVLKTAADVAQKSAGYSYVDWGDFVRKAGGWAATDKLKKGINSKVQTVPLPNRYVLTCRCGLVDMRHFYQMMYIARTYRSAPFLMQADGANRQATFDGREHELKSEATSRFAAEDTPSNALGANLGSTIERNLTPKEFLEQLNAHLRICMPIDFATLSSAEQDLVVNFYGDRGAGGVPVHQNESALPAALALAPCRSKSQDFPFKIDARDSDKKTISQRKEPYSLTGDSEIRDWVAKESCASIDDLPDHEKIRMSHRLLDGWVSDDDVAAIEWICSCTSSNGELAAIDTAIRRRLSELTSQRQRDRVAKAIGGRK